MGSGLSLNMCGQISRRSNLNTQVIGWDRGPARNERKERKRS